MITDALAQLSAAQAVTASAVSTNTIDLLQARDLGPGTELQVAFSVDTTATAAGAATVQFQIISSASANLGSPTILVTTDAIPKATLVAGFRFALDIPRTQITALGQRYIGVQYTVATGPLTAGAFSAAVIIDYSDVVKSYPSGFTVS
jgi:Bbp16-like protein